jgi:hypothetical protein
VAVLGLPAGYVWLLPYLLYAAIFCGAASIISFCWPAFCRAWVVFKKPKAIAREIKLVFPDEANSEGKESLFKR